MTTDRPIRRDEGASGGRAADTAHREGNPLNGARWGGIPQAGPPRKPPLCQGGNAEGSLNPFSLTDGSTSGVILRAGAGISELLPAMRASPRKGRDQNLPAQSNREVVRQRALTTRTGSSTACQTLAARGFELRRAVAPGRICWPTRRLSTFRAYSSDGTVVPFGGHGSRPRSATRISACQGDAALPDFQVANSRINR